MILDEIWNLVNFTLLTPTNLITIAMAFGENMKSKESFKVVYEKILRKVERSDIFVLEFSATFTIAVGFASVIIIILVFFIFPKTRIAS